MTYNIGDLLGEEDRYLLEAELGSGGMGKVFQALDRKLNRRVALKLLRDKVMGREDARLRFDQELRLCAALHSTHIVQVTDCGVTRDDFPFYVMEYLTGVDLDHLFYYNQSIPVERSVKICLQVCAGLRVAHQGIHFHGRHVTIIHRDLKPANIFLVETPIGDLVKILDFGIAKVTTSITAQVLGDQTGLTDEGFIGTYTYASPEQIEGYAHIDARSDIYSLGLVMYQMLTGTNPFGLERTARRSDWLMAQLSQPARPLDEYPHIPKLLAEIVLRCLAKDPDHRFPEISELLLALMQVPLTREDRPPQESRSYLEDLQGEETAVITTILSSVTSDSQDPLPYFKRGSASLALQDYIKALQDFSKAITLDACYTDALNSRAFVYQELGDYAKAIADYDVVLRVDPTNSTVFNNRGFAYYGLKDYQQAMMDFNEAIRFNPQDATAYYNRGNISIQLQDRDRAIADMNEAIRLHPNYVAAYNNRGNLYFAQHDYKSAIADFSRSLTLNPRYAAAYNNRGMVFYRQQEYNKALQDFQSFLELSPQNATALYNRGMVYQALGDLRQAIGDFDESLLLDPQGAAVYNSRGSIYLALRDPDRALADFNAAIHADVQYYEAYISRGNYFCDQQLFKRAFEDFTTAISLAPKNSVVYSYRGYAASKMGDNAQAISDFSEAIRLQPHETSYYRHRGDLYYSLEKYHQAIADFSEAIRLQPHDPYLYRSRGAALILAEQTSKGIADLKRTAELARRQNNESLRLAVSEMLTALAQHSSC